MIAASEMGARILAELEEAQQDTITALLNVVVAPTGDLSEPLVYREACLDLIGNGLVRVSVTRGGDGRLVDETEEQSATLVNLLVGSFTFNNAEKRWVLSDKVDASFDIRTFPNLVLTSSGIAKAVAILNKRGYRWWMIKK
jgi:hypothetical protein